MEIKYEDSPSIHLCMHSFSFYEDVLTEEILKIECFTFEKREQALILQRIEGLFIHINFSFEFAIVQLLLFMVF
ncbi:hypothetical protein Q8G35_18085 [Peribacillus simplex]|uniref:Uncharacterized protein n=2 Tax=Peribacillus TaxID=2675229 RepID=A0AA90PD09_9BACI|nr:MULTISPECIES: hypothetical protein [Peribacillus]MDP1420244.1 hypothetical protein [Peribacillus simplex]MDP1453618.1 hypothetical protein [Peribacillus frigoritolerans]